MCPAGDDILYVNWLSMCRAGVLALMFYNPETNKWGQAHMQARYVGVVVVRDTSGCWVRIGSVPMTWHQSSTECGIHLVWSTEFQHRF